MQEKRSIFGPKGTVLKDKISAKLNIKTQKLSWLFLSSVKKSYWILLVLHAIFSVIFKLFHPPISIMIATVIAIIIIATIKSN